MLSLSGGFTDSLSVQALERRLEHRFWFGLALLLALALGHSLWATSLDGFTVDEPYHIAAGASYVRWGDYRLNPEHPPLVKLIAALAVPPTVLHLPPLTVLNEKVQERVYTQQAVFAQSDGARVHRRARFALYLLNTSLLAALTWLLGRIFGATIALMALLLLALDPTISAHMPVVMTDLPMALLGTICLCAIILALRDRRGRDWVLLGVATGLLLATKHSAPLIVLPLLLGSVATLGWRMAHRQAVGRQALWLTTACVLSVVVLWSTYGFHYRESPGLLVQGQPAETFNRPLTAKINDLHSPLMRRALFTAQKLHLVPRAYIWGLADTLRAGVEGRPFWICAFGQSYQSKAPWWVPFADLIVKLPPAFIVLAIIGMLLLLPGRLPGEVARPLAAFVGMAAFFMLFIAHNGVFYAGLRHWLFVVPLLAVCASVAAWFLCRSPVIYWRAVPLGAVLCIAVTVLPQRRIWEYHNFLAGGSQNAWLSFENESVDLGQRTPEFIAFYKGQIAPAPVMSSYWALQEELVAGGVKRWNPQPQEVANGNLDGWFCFRAPEVAQRDWHDMPTLRNVQPAARFGNLLVYHGNFALPRVAAGILEYRALHTMSQTSDDPKLIEQYLLRSISLDSESAEAAIELGNFALGRRDTDQALHWYALAQKDAVEEPDVLADVEREIQLVKSSPPGSVPLLRNPYKE
ncbi:MAG: glycosyltransferase family 39 protein [Acidobacteriaceae bacterium]